MGWLVTQNPHPARKILVGSKLAPILKKFGLRNRLRVCVRLNSKVKICQEGVNLIQETICSIRARHAKFGPSAIPSKLVFVRRPP